VTISVLQLGKARETAREKWTGNGSIFIAKNGSAKLASHGLIISYT
jgi:hypothetical protein